MVFLLFLITQAVAFEHISTVDITSEVKRLFEENEEGIMEYLKEAH